MKAEQRHSEAIDLERAIYDPEYRRSVIDSLRTKYRVPRALESSNPADPSEEGDRRDRPRRGAFPPD